MIEKSISFVKDDHDPTIDFIKGLCIIFVILTHCFNEEIRQHTLFCLWGEMAVPTFLLLQVFHAYKGGIDKSKFKVKKIYKRILRPFIIIEMSLLLIMTILGGGNLQIIRNFATCGGWGAGSYYIWVYLQFAAILPLLAPFISKIDTKWLLIIFIFISALLEFFCCTVNIPPRIYRLLAFRYFFIIWLGVDLVRGVTRMNKLKWIVSFISMSFILYFYYFSEDTSPWFYPSGINMFH